MKFEKIVVTNTTTKITLNKADVVKALASFIVRSPAYSTELNQTVDDADSIEIFDDRYRELFFEDSTITVICNKQITVES